MSLEGFSGIGFAGTLTMVLRDRDGRIKAVRHTHNNVCVGIFNWMASGMANSDGVGNSAVCLALGSGPDQVSTDTTLSGEIAISRTGGARYSHDADDHRWNFSWCVSGAAGQAPSVRQAGLLTSLTGGTLLLKATFAELTIDSTDVLNVTWRQSLESGG